jgi:hypothetical protein
LTNEPPTSNASRSEGSPSFTSISSFGQRVSQQASNLSWRRQPFFTLSIIC